MDALVLQCASEESLPALEAVVKRMEEILGKYQEQPSLLDGHLNSIIAPIMARIRSTLIAQHAACIQSQLSEASGSLVIEMRASPAVHKLFQIVYLVSKTRGYKHIVRLMPHEVADLEPALLLLRSQDRGEHSTWETRYVLFLWLSILVLVPFDLTTADSMSSEPSGAAGSGGLPVLTCVRQSYSLTPFLLRSQPLRLGASSPGL